MSIPPYTTDTSKDAEAVQIALIRQMAPTERVSKSLHLTQGVLKLAKEAIRRRHPHMSEEELSQRFIELHYDLANAVRQYKQSRGEVAASE